MKNLKIRKMIIVLLVAVVVMSISTRVLATGLTDPTEGINITLDYPTDDKTDDKTPEPSTPSTPTTPEPSTPNTPSQEQEKLPQTGDASDYAIFLLIGLFAVVSIYAYKKVKDYNRI